MVETDKLRDGIDYLAHFEEVVSRQQLSHAYLFTGKDDVAKQRLATYIIQLLANRNVEANQWDSDPVHQRIARNQYPDVFYLEPDGQVIKVDQIRGLKEWLATTPVEGDFKAAVIKQAESMNPSAANALLRFLEEPSDNIYLFLLSSDADKILPTILSRVQQVHLLGQYKARDQELLLTLVTHPAHIDLLTHFSLEMIERLSENYQTDNFQAWLDHLNDYYRGILTKDPMAFITVQTKLKTYLTVQGALDAIEYLWLLNYSILIQDFPQRTSTGLQNYFVKQLFDQVKPNQDQLLKISEELLRCKQLIQANVTPQLAFEDLVIRLQ